MELVAGYDHQPGVNCAAAALRNVSSYYGWHYDEPTCFGIGGGPAFVRYDHPEASWHLYRTTPTWTAQAFFERLGVPHSFRRGDDFETAWANVTTRIDEDDPILLFLDPDPLPYHSEGPSHLPPHVAVLIGYDEDEDTVVLSDGGTADRQQIARSTLRAAWQCDGPVALDHDSVVVTRPRVTEAETDAVAAGLRQASTYMLDPLQITRDAHGPGEEGLAALRSFAETLGTWSTLSDPDPPVRTAQRSLDEHGERSASRDLFAESLDVLGQRTGLSVALSDRMADIARQWRTVTSLLEDILLASDPGPAPFEEASSVVADIADREQAVFEDLAVELGNHVD